MNLLTMGQVPTTGGPLTAPAMRMLDRTMDDMEATGQVLVDMMQDMTVSLAEMTGQGLHINVSV